MIQSIDIATLRKLRDQQISMVDYYSRSSDKVAQNAAMVAAGLPPIHRPADLQWDIDQGAKHRRYVEALDAVLEYLGVNSAEAA